MDRPSFNQIFKAARNVLRALYRISETRCCLIGGLAVKLLGADHDVSDIDILVLDPETDQRDIQDALIDLYPDDFGLEYPEQPNVSFMKLFYHIPGVGYPIKIDLLLSTAPGVEIPRTLRLSHFVWPYGLPVAPIYFVLYHKLLGWEKRIESGRLEQARDKDCPDILNLCIIAASQSVRPLSKSHMGREYLYKFWERAENFVKWYGGDSGKKFRRIRILV